jgi:hypothetical protein
MENRHLLHEFMTGQQRPTASKSERYIRWSIYALVLFNFAILAFTFL